MLKSSTAVGHLSRHNRRRNIPKMVQALALGAALAFTSGAASAEDWVGTWTASVQPVWDADFPVPTNIPRSLWNQTIRQTVRRASAASASASCWTNEYGSRPARHRRGAMSRSRTRGRRSWRAATVP